jgi:hypothetical protein
MAAKGASLQNYNHELVRCISDLREKVRTIGVDALTKIDATICAIEYDLIAN